MKIEATEEQIKQIAANAVNAAQPMGMGFLHYTPKIFKPEEFKLHERGLFLDYVEGRMTKLYIWRRGGDIWEFPPNDPHVDYQSWADKYPTYQALIESVIPVAKPA